MAQPGYIFGGNTGETPQSLATKRALAQQIMGLSAPKNIGEGFMALANGFVAGNMRRQADEAEKAGMASADPIKQQIIAAITGKGAVPSYAPATASDASATMVPSASDAVQGETPWLSYGNQGATRNLPLSNDLVSALSLLPELGVNMEVFSGGQPGEGEGPRVGSTRHDHGNAADVFFSQNGRRLDWSNPDDLPIFEEIVRRGKAAGITGFGAGDGYMQPGSMHIGFGNPGVWGAGGDGANAPDWLRNAYDGGESSPLSAQGQGAGELPLETLLSAVSNPFLMADPGMVWRRW